jgi:hypothetical protein
MLSILMRIRYPNPNPDICLSMLLFLLQGCRICLLYEMICFFVAREGLLLSLVNLAPSAEFNDRNPHTVRKQTSSTGAAARTTKKIVIY